MLPATLRVNFNLACLRLPVCACCVQTGAAHRQMRRIQSKENLSNRLLLLYGLAAGLFFYSKRWANKVYEKIVREKQGSRAFRRALAERDEIINIACKTLDSDNVKELFC